MAVSEIPSPKTCDQREASLKASISETMTIKLRMNSVWYFFSNIKPEKNDTYSWQAAYTQSFYWGQKWCLSSSHTCKKFLLIFIAYILTATSPY